MEITLVQAGMIPGLLLPDPLAPEPSARTSKSVRLSSTEAIESFRQATTDLQQALTSLGDAAIGATGLLQALKEAMDSLAQAFTPRQTRYYGQITDSSKEEQSMSPQSLAKTARNSLRIAVWLYALLTLWYITGPFPRGTMQSTDSCVTRDSQ